MSHIKSLGLRIRTGVFLLFFTLTTGYFVGYTTDLACERPEPTTLHCVRQRKLFGLFPLSETSVPTIQFAFVSQSCDHNNICTYRVELDTVDGIIPLAPLYIPNFNQQANSVARINNFLDNSQWTQFDLDTNPINRPTMLIFLLVGGLSLWLIGRGIDDYITEDIPTLVKPDKGLDGTNNIGDIDSPPQVKQLPPYTPLHQILIDNGLIKAKMAFKVINLLSEHQDELALVLVCEHSQAGIEKAQMVIDEIKQFIG